MKKLAYKDVQVFTDERTICIRIKHPGVTRGIVFYSEKEFLLLYKRMKEFMKEKKIEVK